MKKLISILNNHKLILVFIILAFSYRLIFLADGRLSFHYDMARDAFIAEEIWKYHDLKILGPPTSTTGLYHGVLYYYLIAPFYALGQGDPRIPALVIALINSLTVIPILILVKNIFKDKRWEIFSGIIYLISFESVQYATWLSNPSPAILTVSLFFLGLWRWLNNKRGGFYLAVLSAVISVQFQLFCLYLFLVLVVFKFIFRLRITNREILTGSVILFFGLSSIIISIIKFNQLTNIMVGLMGIGVNPNLYFRVGFTELLTNYLNSYSQIFINNFIPINVFLGGILGIICTVLAYRNRFIFFCLMSSVLIFILGGHTSVYAQVGIITPGILALVIFLKKLKQTSFSVALLLVFMIIISNMYMYYKLGPFGQTLLVIPQDMILSNQLKLIDESYRLAKYQEFSINTLTLPLWTNTTWAYLYSWYGYHKYGYVPKFYGKDQVGLLGNDKLQKIPTPLAHSFYIIEPLDGINGKLYTDELNYENSRTVLVNEVTFKSLKLQQRSPKIDYQKI